MLGISSGSSNMNSGQISYLTLPSFMKLSSKKGSTICLQRTPHSLPPSFVFVIQFVMLPTQRLKCVRVCVSLAENLKIPGSGKNLLVLGVGASPKELDAVLFQALLLETSVGPFQGV